MARLISKKAFAQARSRVRNLSWRWLWQKAGSRGTLAIGVCALGILLGLAEKFAKGRRKASAKPPLPHYIELDQQWEQSIDGLGYTIACLLANCSAPLSACAAHPDCRTTLRAAIRDLDGPGSDETTAEMCERLDVAGMFIKTQSCPKTYFDFRSCYVGQCSRLPLLERHAPFIFRGNFSADELPRIGALREAVVANATLARLVEKRRFGVGEAHMPGDSVYKSNGHKVTHVHTVADDMFPGLIQRLHALALEADRARGWGIQERMRKFGKPPPGVRCVEIINYSSHQSQSLGWHYDGLSLMTMSVMLSSRNDYDGGVLEVRANHHRGEVISYDLGPGDVAVFESWRPHRVTPVTRGVRIVLVVELWEYGSNDGVATRPRENETYDETFWVMKDKVDRYFYRNLIPSKRLYAEDLARMKSRSRARLHVPR